MVADTMAIVGATGSGRYTDRGELRTLSVYGPRNGEDRIAMKEKIQVKICAGTACFVLGADALTSLPELVPTKWLERVEFRGIGCLDRCKDHQYGQAPYVMIDDELISSATPQKVMDRLQELLRE